jgi:MurNAc alpha-1-phosphate uridylyltransferase
MIEKMREEKNIALAHLVMVSNPPYHLEGDFVLNRRGMLEIADEKSAGEKIASEQLTFGNIGIYHTRLFANIAPDVPQKLTPYYRQWIAQGIVSGERYDGAWFNVGAPEDLEALDKMLNARI